jgi:DNA repair exonuclease SbcCD nuclease subunit
MSEIRFLTSSDEHLSDQTPGFRKDDYRAAIFSKLRWQGTAARKFGADAVLRGGDYFHVKMANRTSMATMIESMAIHGGYPCPTYSIVGNHDMVYNDPTTLCRQPLGVLFESGVFKRLKEEVFESGSLSVRVVGVDYTPSMTTSVLCELVKSKGHSHTVAVVHSLAEMSPSQRTQSFFNEEILDYRDLVFPGCPDVYVFGHYHKDQSIVEHMGIHFVNLGAVSRGALTVDNLERKPKISLIKFDSSGLSIEEQVVPHEDASRVFDLDRKQAAEDGKKSMEAFLDKLRTNAAMIGGNDIKMRMKRFMESDEFSFDEKKAVREVFEAAEAGQEEL